MPLEPDKESGNSLTLEVVAVGKGEGGESYEIALSKLETDTRLAIRQETSILKLYDQATRANILKELLQKDRESQESLLKAFLMWGLNAHRIGELIGEIRKKSEAGTATQEEIEEMRELENRDRRLYDRSRQFVRLSAEEFEKLILDKKPTSMQALDRELAKKFTSDAAAELAKAAAAKRATLSPDELQRIRRNEEEQKRQDEAKRREEVERKRREKYFLTITNLLDGIVEDSDYYLKGFYADDPSFRRRLESEDVRGTIRAALKQLQNIIANW